MATGLYHIAPCVPLPAANMHPSVLCCTLHSPLYGEEFSFRVPRDFRRLSFYVCDSDLFGLTGTRLGKVSIPADHLVTGTVQEDQWNPIQPIHADSEVQV